MDLAEQFEKLIDVCNSGSIELFFADLKGILDALTVEDQRGVAEGLNEEGQAVFSILTKPEPVPSKFEKTEVKNVCKDLLAALKREKLVLDWREKQ